MDALTMLKNTSLPFAKLLGIELTSASPERVTAQMRIREDLCTNPAVAHGGAIMALADTLGAGARRQHDHRRLRGDSSRAAHDGMADARDHCGREAGRNRHADADGTDPVGRKIKEMGDKTQTPQQMMASLFVGLSRFEQMELLSRLEVAGANIYRAFAADEKNVKAKEQLLKSAEREEANGALLKLMTTHKSACEKCGKAIS